MITYSIIQKSQLEGALRLDAEYYQPEYLVLNSKLKTQNSKFLGDLAKSIICGPFGSAILQEDYRERGIPLIRVADLSDWFVKDDDLVFIEESISQEMKRYQVVEGDVVVSQRGTIAMFSKVTDKFPKWNISANLISIKKSENIDFDYLLAFLNSKYGIDQLFRKLSGQVQPKITTDDVKSILVFVPREKIQKSISELVQQAWREQENSKSLYSQAEDLLLEELGLKDFKPEEELSFIVNLSDVKSAHRADAEYFQPKYEKLIKQITKKYQTKQLKELAVVKRGSLIDPRFYNELEGTPYIRGKDFSSGRLEKSGLVYINKNFRLGKEIRVKKGDLVFSSIGSVGASALVTQEFEDSFISNNTGKISLKDKKELLPEYLAVVLRSIIGQSWFEKEASQTAQPKISDSQVRSFYIPILPKPTQQKIADLVQKSHEARKQAKQLLEEAKQKVEKLIEK